MSDSPKYSTARLLEEIERHLRQQREIQATLERARRQAEEERRRLERLENRREHVRKQLAAAEVELMAFFNSDNARFIPSQRREALRRRIRDTDNGFLQAKREEDLGGFPAAFQEIRDEIRAQRVEAESAKLSADLANEEASLFTLEQEIKSLDRSRAEKFDWEGFEEVNRLLSQARQHLTQKAIENLRRETTAARNRLKVHQYIVTERFSLWQAAKNKAEIAIAGAEDRLAGLRADEVILRWMADVVANHVDRLAATAKLLREEMFEKAFEEASELIKESERIVHEGQEWQLKEDRRQYIVTGIVDVMQKMGFVMQKGYPALEHPNALASATTIQAVRIGGGAIAISIPQEGQVWYDVSGFPLRSALASNGRTIQTCDEAEEEIIRIHEAMKEAFGIQMSELLWDNKDPNRIRKTAESRPGSAPLLSKTGN